MTQRQLVFAGAVLLGAAVAYRIQRDRAVRSRQRVTNVGHTDRGGARMLLETKVSPDHYPDRRYGYLAEPYEMDQHMFARAHPLTAHVPMLSPTVRGLAEHGWGWIARPPSEETI
jgi:hypothetical protein